MLLLHGRIILGMKPIDGDGLQANCDRTAEKRSRLLLSNHIDAIATADQRLNPTSRA